MPKHPTLTPITAAKRRPSLGNLAEPIVGQRSRVVGPQLTCRWCLTHLARVNVTLLTGTTPAMATVPTSLSPTKLPSKVRTLEPLSKFR